jgi:F-type H+-transporting ATPase subunit epsilon
MPVLFNFEVHTPYRLFFSGKVQSITLTLSDGEIGVYANHSPFTAPVLSCALRIKDDGGIERSAFISDGILEVKEHKNVLMVDAAEWPEEIDVERAHAAKQTIEEKLNASLPGFEQDHIKKRLRRAEFRIKIYEESGIVNKKPVA